MIVNRLIVYAGCVLLTCVSATQAEQDVIQVDFDKISDIIDYNLEHIKDPDKLLAELNMIIPGNKFLKVWNKLQEAKQCDRSLICNLILMDKYATPSVEFGHQSTSKMVHRHFMRALKICSKDSENHFQNKYNKIITKDIRGLFKSEQRFMQERCTEDKFCLQSTFVPSDLEVITKDIYGTQLGQKKDINRIKLSYKMLTMTQNCPDSNDIRIELLKIIVAHYEKLGSSTRDFLNFLFLCQSYKDKEHKHIDHLAKLNGEPDRPTPCYEIIIHDLTPRRRICPVEEKIEVSPHSCHKITEIAELPSDFLLFDSIDE